MYEQFYDFINVCIAFIIRYVDSIVAMPYTMYAPIRLE